MFDCCYLKQPRERFSCYFNRLNDFSDSILDVIRMSMSTVSILILLEIVSLHNVLLGNYDDLNGFKSKVNRYLLALGPFSLGFLYDFIY